MARAFARVKTSIWQDQDFVGLSPLAQRLYFLLLSQPGLSYCGTLSYTPRRWARLAPNTTMRDIERLVAELEASRFVVVDKETEELLIRSFVRHDGVLKQPQLVKAMWSAFAEIASEPLRAAFAAGLPEGCAPPCPSGSTEPLAPGRVFSSTSPTPATTPAPAGAADLDPKVEAMLDAEMSADGTIKHPTGWREWRRPLLEAELEAKRESALKDAAKAGTKLGTLYPNEPLDALMNDLRSQYQAEPLQVALTALVETREAMMGVG